MNNTAFVLALAYPDTIVSHAEEWYSPYLRYIGIGNKTSVRAGHAALVLINKETKALEYYDFGRYITPKPYGRVRSSQTDNELNFGLKAEIKNDSIVNLDAILRVLATNPELTHGKGRLLASVCNVIDYELAKSFISKMENYECVNYAAFKKKASNCARFITDTLIASITDLKIKKALEKSKWFTPSTVGNVIIANTGDFVFEVSDKGVISKFIGSQKSENLKCFLDRLKDYKPKYEGSLKPLKPKGLHKNAQWLSGIGAGAWYEVYKTEVKAEYRYKRISPHGNIDCDALFIVEDANFDFEKPYEIIYNSNCHFFHVKQNENIFRFNRKY